MDLASFIDHTILRSDCSRADIEEKCKEALKYRFFAVCVPPYYVKNAVRHLKGSKVKVATAIGFPMGYSLTPVKVGEIQRAVDDGADEVDVVVNVSAVKNKEWNYVRNDIESMIVAAHLKGKVIKVIFETGLLTREEVIELCKICNEMKPDFAKTSTGFNGGGATVEIVRLLRENLEPEIRIKASGGIRGQEDALKLIEAGAKRLGSSSGIAIVGED